MDGKDFEIEFQVWIKRMGIVQHTKKELIKKLCRGERRETWKQIMKYVRPAHEVELIRKKLAYRKAELREEYEKKLKEKEESLHIIEQNVEQASKKLRMLNCEVHIVKERTRELDKKTLLLHCKGQDLEEEMKLYEQLHEVILPLQWPSFVGCGDANVCLDKQMETMCEKAVQEMMISLRDFNKFYETNKEKAQDLHVKKESVMEFVRLKMKDLPATLVWKTLLNMKKKLNCELRDLLESCIENKPHLIKQKEQIDREFHLFSKSYLEMLKQYYSLQQRLINCGRDSDMLNAEVIQTLQDKMCVSKSTETAAEIKKMLELETKIVELDAKKEVFKNAVTSMKMKMSNNRFVDVRKEELDKINVDIDKLKTDIKTSYLWFTRSCAKLNRSYESLQQDVSRLPEMFSSDTKHEDIMDELKVAFQKELKEFMELPLNVFDNVTLPSGVTLPRSQQMLKYHLNAIEAAQPCDLPNILTILNRAPATSPDHVILHTLTNKWYFNALKNGESSSSMNISYGDMTVKSLQHAENVGKAVLADAMNFSQSSVSECNNIIGRAEYNYKAWVEHPLQLGIPDTLEFNGKSFKEWQEMYNGFLLSLGPLGRGYCTDAS